MPPWAPRWPEAGAVLGAAERWLLPGECLLCREAVDRSLPDALICGPCRARWSPLPLPACPGCGAPLTPGSACRLCRDWPGTLRGVRSAVWLEDGARTAVHLFKYEGWWRIAEALAAVIHRAVALPRDGVLVPVPLGAARQRTRGYNQSAVLARALGRLCGLPVDEAALQRRRETATQTALTPEARRANLAGAFACAATPPAVAILVDDVFTTGATLAEAAGALERGGAAQVTGVTFARAPRPLADASRALPPGPEFLRRRSG